MLYQCDHMDCLHKFWVEIKSLHEEITCPKCKRRSGVVIGFVVCLTNENKVRNIDLLHGWLDKGIDDAVSWLNNEE